MLLKTFVHTLGLLLSSSLLPAQQNPFYTFQVDDTILKKTWIQSIRQVEKSWIATINPSHKKDYESIYKSHFEQIEKTISDKSCITAKEPHEYLQQIVSRIINANPALKADELRIFFTRDLWPNAYSMGDGSIAINAGLMIHLRNEAELAFVLCHELAHYYKGHTLQSVDNYVTLTNSAAFQNKLKELSKKEYGVNAELEKLSLNLIFNSRHHSRSKETEADRQAFSFFKNTGYDAKGILSLLQLLDTVDQASVFPTLHLPTMLSFENYPFKKKWIQDESAIFSKINIQTAEEKANEIDSFKTHPDCSVRIADLKDSLASQFVGNQFMVNEKYFHLLKEALLLEMIEHTYQSNNVSRNIYYNLLLIQQQKQTNLAAYFIVRDLNLLYEQQKNHKVGLLLDTENKFYSKDYNELLRFLNRIRLNEMAQVTHFFCKRFLVPLKHLQPVSEQITIAEQNHNQH